MSLYVDKYRPKDLSKLDYHQDQAQQLKKLVQGDDFPHLLVFGPSGAGKKTRIACLLRQLYGSGVDRLQMQHKEFQTPNGKKLQVSTLQSNYHIEMNPSDCGYYDRIVIQEVIKEMAQTQQLDSGSQKSFKVLVLNEVDSLSVDAQHALRRTMEKYISTCRLILCCESCSKVIAPLRSRCLPIRVPAPNDKQIVSVLENVAYKESLKLAPELAQRIAVKSGGNLRRALLYLEATRVKCSSQHLTADLPLEEPDWEKCIATIARLCVQQQTPETLLKVRERLYELLVHCIPPQIIFERLVIECSKTCDAYLKPQLVSIAAQYEHRMHLGTKHIFHLEAFVARFMTIYKKFLEGMALDM